MSDDEHIVIDVDINANRAGAGADGVNKAFDSIINHAERAARSSASAQHSVFAEALTKNQTLVSQIAGSIGGHYGRMGAYVLNFARTYDEVGRRAEAAAHKAAEQTEAAARKALASKQLVLEFGQGFLKVEGDVQKLTTAYNAFLNALGRAASGKGSGAIGEFKNLGIDIEHALRNPEQAFGKFLTGLQNTKSEAGRTAAVINVLGESNAKLVGSLENAGVSLVETGEGATGAAAGMVGATGAAVGLGTTMIAILAPILAVVAAVALIAGTVAILYKAAEAAAEYGTQIYDASKKTGTTTEFMSTLAVAAAEVGVPLTKVTTGFSQFEKAASQAARGYGNNRAIFQGIDKDFKSLVKTQEGTQQLFVEFSKKVAGASDSADKFNLIQQVTSRNGRELAQVLTVVGNDFDGIKKRAADLGLLITPQQAQEAKDFEIATNRLHLAVTGFVLTVGKPWVKTFTDVLETIQHLMTGTTAATQAATQQVGEHHTKMQTVVEGTLVLMSGNWLRLTLFVLTHIKSIVAAIETIPDAVNAMATVVSVALDAVDAAFIAAGEGAAAFVLEAQGQYGAATALFTDATTRMSYAADKLKVNYSRALDDIGKSYERHRDALNFTYPASEEKDNPTDLPAKVVKAKKALTDYEKLVKQYHELQFQLTSLEDTGSPVNVLKFKVEDLQKVKTDFEEILKLRHELGLPIATPLPARTDHAAIQETIDSLKDMVKYKQAVKEATDAQDKADFDYALALKTYLLPVVDAGTRAETAYLKAVHDRRDAETQLTADVIRLARMRRDALADETGATALAYRGLQKELLTQVESSRGDALKERLLQQIERGGVAFEVGVENKISGRVEIHEPTVPKEIVNIESYVRELAETSRKEHASGAGGDLGAGGGATRANAAMLSAFAEARGFTTTFSTGGTHNKGSLHGSGYAIDVRTRDHSPDEVAQFIAEARAAGLTALDERHRLPGEQVWHGQHVHLQGSFNAGAAGDLGGMPTGDGSATASGLLDRVRDGALKALGLSSVSELATPKGAVAVLTALGQIFGGQPDDAVKTTTSAVGQTVTDLRGQLARDTAETSITRPQNERDFRMRVEQYQQELEAAQTTAEKQIQFERDVADTRQQYDRQRKDEYKATTVTIEVLSAELAKAEAGDAEFVRRVQAKAEQEHLNARLALNERLASLDYEIKHATDDAALEYQVAWKEAILAVETADVEATKRRAAAEVALADKTVYHAEQANAKVLEYLAQQRGVTDVIADFRVNVIEATYKTIDDGLDRITRKLGVVGSILKDLLSGLIRLALNSAFQKLFGGQGATLAVGGSGGGGSLGGLIIKNFLGGGSNASAGGAGGLSIGGGASFLGNVGGQGVFQLGNGSIVQGTLDQTTGLINLAPSGTAGAGLTSLYGSATQAAAGAGLTSLYDTSTQAAAASALVRDASAGTAGKVGAAASSGAAAGTVSALAAALPLLGLTAGSSLGGTFFQSSRLAQGIGTVAGGALGLSAGLAGYAALGGTFGAGALGTTAAALASALPIIAPAAAVALIAAYFINRSAERRKEETDRTKILTDSNAQLDAIIASMRAGKTSGDDALAQALTIRANYLTQVGQLKDSKTRRIAQETVRELDYRINIIKRLAPIVDNAQQIDTKLIPTFGEGGRFSIADFSGRGLVSAGGYDGRDRYVVAIADDETIISPRDRAALGGSERFRQAGIRGYAGGGSNTVSSPSYRPSASATSGGAPSKIVVVQVTDQKYADDVVAMLSARGEGVLAVKVGNQVDRDGVNGLAGRIAAQFEQ